MCGAFDCLIHGRCLVSDRDRVPSFKTGFHHTALVIRATLIAIFVAQVDFHSRYVIADSDLGICHRVTDVGAQRLMVCYVMVGVYLYLHGVLLPSLAFWLSIIFRLRTPGLEEPDVHIPALVWWR
jgi:hypothetical protein